MIPTWQQQLEDAMEQNFAQRGECGASVVVCDRDGQILHEIHRGHADRARSRAWSAETLIPIYSATKGLAAATLLGLLHEQKLEPTLPLTHFWPEFPLPGSSIAQVLHHQCGLAWLERKADVLDHAAVIEAVEHQPPAWQPPATGYHPRTWGFLVDEIARRLSGGIPLAQHFERIWRKPWQLDAWIALPASKEARVGELLTGRLTPESQNDPVYQALAVEGSEPRRAFSSPRGLHSVAEMNTAASHAAGLPGFGGVASARGLAKFYAALLSDEALPRWLRTQVQQQQIQTEHDRILLRPLRFALGFQLDPLDAQGQKIRHRYGPSVSAFGHPGAGGSHAWADPERGLSFAYTMNQMELSILPGPRAQSLVTALNDQ